MGRHFSHLNSAVKIIEKYDGSLPFNNFIKAFFSKEKRYGSKDRRQIASLCYAFFRSGHLLKKEVAEKIITSVFLSEQSYSDFLAEIRPEWNERITHLFADKLAFLQKNSQELFPFLRELSSQVDRDLFIRSLLVQPSLFLRIRPGKKQSVESKLNAAGIPFELLDEDCVSLANSTKAEDIFKINEEVVVQDLNSQKVLDFVKGKYITELPESWDCCAASGGKSILLFDRLKGKVRLTVTDIRETILSKLHTRLHNAGIGIEQSYLADLSQSGLPANNTFDIILCDVPCTGSGTWSRTPEQMFYFQKSKIHMYAELQKKIIANSIPSLKKGALFFYITCSVFSEENEQQVEFIKTNFAMKQLHLEYLKGYEIKADTMFVAVFKAV